MSAPDPRTFPHCPEQPRALDPCEPHDHKHKQVHYEVSTHIPLFADMQSFTEHGGNTHERRSETKLEACSSIERVQGWTTAAAAGRATQAIGAATVGGRLAGTVVGDRAVETDLWLRQV